MINRTYISWCNHRNYRCIYTTYIYTYIYIHIHTYTHHRYVYIHTYIYIHMIDIYIIIHDRHIYHHTYMIHVVCTYIRIYELCIMRFATPSSHIFQIRDLRHLPDLKICIFWTFPITIRSKMVNLNFWWFSSSPKCDHHSAPSAHCVHLQRDYFSSPSGACNPKSVPVTQLSCSRTSRSNRSNPCLLQPDHGDPFACRGGMLVKGGNDGWVT